MTSANICTLIRMVYNNIKVVLYKRSDTNG
jgi:hypothetical protein